MALLDGSGFENTGLIGRPDQRIKMYGSSAMRLDMSHAHIAMRIHILCSIELTMLYNLTLLEPVLNRKLLAELCWDKASGRVRMEPRVVTRREIRHDGGEVDGLTDPAADPGLEDTNRHVLHQRVHRDLQSYHTSRGSLRYAFLDKSIVQPPMKYITPFLTTISGLIVLRASFRLFDTNM